MDNYFLESLGSKIKILRKTRRVTQEDLAKQSEITRTYLTQIENGKVNPSIGKIKKISENLNISLCEMFKDI